LQDLVAFKNYNYLNLYVHFFQSAQVIKFRNVLVSLNKHKWSPNSPNLNPLIIMIVWTAMPGRYQKYTPKPTNVVELKIALIEQYSE